MYENYIINTYKPRWFLYITDEKIQIQILIILSTRLCVVYFK